MSIEKHVTSLELSKRLKELGVKQESEFYWAEIFITQEIAVVSSKSFSITKGPIASAFLSSELGELLPEDCYLIKRKRRQQESYGWYCKSFRNDSYIQFSNTEADARANMLIYLIENKIIDAPIRHSR